MKSTFGLLREWSEQMIDCQIRTPECKYNYFLSISFGNWRFGESCPPSFIDLSEEVHVSDGYLSIRGNLDLDTQSTFTVTNNCHWRTVRSSEVLNHRSYVFNFSWVVSKLKRTFTFPANQLKTWTLETKQKITNWKIQK